MNEISLSKKEIRNRLNSIRIKPKGLEKREYGVSVKYFNENEQVPYKRIDYELTLDLKIILNQGELFIDKKSIYYNQHEPDLINEIISNLITQSIYPLKVELNEKGQTPNKILNYDEIQNRWKNQQKIISEKYESEALSTFFETVNHKFENKSQLEKSLHHDWFWNLFFHPKLVNYGERRTIETDLYLAVIPYQSPVRFKGIQKIEKIPTDYYSFVISFNSIEQKAPKYFYPANKPESLEIYMQLNVEYDLDIFHHFSMHTRATLTIYTKDILENKTIIKRIEFTQYQQNTETYKDKKLTEDSPFITGGLVKLPPNKWGFDNFENLENDW